MSKKKVILSTIALLLVMFVAVSVVSYSIATKGHGDSNKEIAQNSMTNLGVDLSGMEYVTNIDLIIENAVEKDEPFHIVEIVPSGVSASDLKTYVENEGFSKYVISANKDTATQDMPQGMVDYQLLTVDSTMKLTDSYGTSTVQEIIDNADLIYLSSPSYKSYDGNSNMSEEIYNKLHVYALGSNKPLIMDYVTSASTGTTSYTYGGLVNAVSRNHIKFRTYSWAANLSATKFFSAQGSYYLKYNVNNSAATGNVLVIANTDTPGADSLYGRMSADDSVVLQNAYYGLNSKKPKKMNYTIWNVSSSALTVAELEKSYDFILIESDVKNTIVSSEVYQKLRALSESSKYILYDAGLVSTSTGSVSGSANNYLKLMQMLISEKGVELKTNVLAINYGYFTSLNEQGADGIDGAKAIADLINGTIYRDSDKTGANGKKYRVLEIQPCYPVDLEVAASKSGTTKYAQDSRSGIKGAYYTRPNEVLSGVTKDEIEDGTEYYAFELSKAKIAHATGIAYNQIEVVQMSANELISSKDVISEEYDLVYVGGDASALLPYNAINYTSGDYGGMIGDINRYVKAFTAFDMYTHTGHFVNYQLEYNKVTGGTNSVTFNGNDLTTIKRDELMDYVDSGLPIIIDQKVAAAFERSYQYDKDNENATSPSRLEQLKLHDIDPDCNMYQFLAYAYEKGVVDSAVNVGWGLIDAATDEKQVENVKEVLDENTGVIQTIDRAYGNTLGTTVTVYNPTCEAKITDLITLSATRPSLSVTEYPKQYVEGNDATTNTSATATFKASVKSSSTDVTTGSYKMTLLVDANGDGTYSETEEVDSKSCSAGEEVSLSYALDEDFFGLVNWKIKVTDSKGVLCDVTSGNAFFKVTEDMKKTVRVLQLMPVDETSESANAIGDGHSLYFCTECQQATKVIGNNITINSNATQRINLDSYNNSATVFGNVNVGKHEHDFGVVKYDSTTGFDDWESNFADTLTHGEDGTTETGDYEFDLDILTVKEFEELCSDAAGRDEDTVEVAAAIADEKLVEYEEALQSAALATYRTILESELYKAVESIRTSAHAGAYKNVILEGIGTADHPGQWMIDQDYYKLWEYFNGGTQAQTNAISNYNSLVVAYNSYIEEYDKAVELKEQYKTNLRQAGDSETWLLNNYDIIILGLADEFNNKDLSVNACTQLKTYTSQGGSILNSHDTLTAKAGGADTMSDELRATFGMDRFHVLDYNSSTAVKVSTVVPKAVEQDLIVYMDGASYASYAFKALDKNMTLHLGGSSNALNVNDCLATPAATSSTGDKIVLAITLVNSDGSAIVGKNIKISVPSNQWDTSKYIAQGITGSDGTVNIEIPKATKDQTISGEFTLGNSNVDVAFDLATGKASAKALDTDVAEDGTLAVQVTTTNNGTKVADGTSISVDYRGNVQTATTTNGVVTFTIDPEQAATSSILDTPTGCKYRIYKTKDNTKYFWTERLKAASEADYTSVLSSAGVSVNYNAPVGITDLFAAYDSKSIAVSPFRYADMAPESFDHYANVDGWNYEAKYGTRRAEKVNEAGVTMYPFAISDELLISPTHAQTFSLDLEDPSVAVWYTLAGTYVNDGAGVDSTVQVSEGFAQYVSSFFAASPKDGMNNYFLYSKENVFYTGAGHQLITGRLKDNNDERRLFINVVVNSVTKGVTSPKLKLYNECNDKDSKHDNCDDYYVDPKDDESNDELSKTPNTLFYNKSLEMYQYNIEEDQLDVYPEFDFKAIAGTADIKEIQVFYDLNYGEADNMDHSDLYVDDDNHVLITSYDKKDNMDGIRVRLREGSFKKLKLKEEYFEKYKNYTYIVIRVKDEKGKWKSARVKINVIPHLFDLTDASFDSIEVAENTVLCDKKQFNI